MKEIYKNPFFYYIVIPVFLLLWPFFVLTVYLPGSEKSWGKEKVQYNKAQEVMAEILALDPDRLESAGGKDAGAKFDYATAIEKVASLYAISATNYKLSSGRMITTADQKSQSANVSLKQVDLTKFSNFLSTIQLRWASLQCTKIKLTKKKGLPDSWDVDLAFKYYY